MMARYFYCIVLAFTCFCTSCGGDDGSTARQFTGPITFDQLERGTAHAEVSGNEDFAITGYVGANNSLIANFDGKEYVVLFVEINSFEPSESKRVSFKFFIPRALEQGIPNNGEIPIASESSALDETYATVFIAGGSTSYASSEMTTGVLTITNSSLEEVVFDMEFDLENITSGSGGSVDMNGVMKF
ncbi:MAG: hypothetical protein AAFO69_21430 [Bacteroidota bacterium]